MQGTDKSSFLIERSSLSDKEKHFLKTHIETMEYILDSILVENSTLKDLVDIERRRITVFKDEVISLVNEDIANIIEEVFRKI